MTSLPCIPAPARRVPTATAALDTSSSSPAMAAHAPHSTRVMAGSQSFTQIGLPAGVTSPAGSGEKPSPRSSAIRRLERHPMTLNPLRTAAMSLLLPLLTSLACAGPIVAVGSSYSVYLAGAESIEVLNTGPVVFDSNTAFFTRAGLSLSLAESQVDHGNGKHTITIKMSADGDLFPVAGEASRVGLGTLGTPLSFLKDVYLDSGRISYFGADDAVYFTTNNLADDFRVQYFSGAWNGYFPRPTGVFLNGNVGGRDTRGFSFVFDVTEIPEPNAAALAALALLALAASRRRGALPSRR